MNADSGFESKELRQICKEKEIHANTDINSRNTKIEPQTTEHQYLIPTG